MKQIWTIGHWTCPEQAFIELLAAARIAVLVDVRAQPGSRRSPQFAQDAMRAWLPRADLEYVYLPELGGRRRKQDVDPAINAGWQNQSFKNYADYTLAPQYSTGIAELLQLAETRRVAYMCGEPMPWRCHRLLVSNTLTARGWTVWHLFSGRQPQRHELGKWGAAPTVGPHAQVRYPLTEPNE
jgi:uncharacterized protein (DUF488 family)